MIAMPCLASGLHSRAYIPRLVMYKVPLLPFFLLLSQVGAAHLYHPRSFNAQCQPFHTTFPSSSISNIRHTSYAPTPFIAISEEGSYQTTHGGLELYINKPEGNVRTKHGVNDKTADGATVNSTFSILYVLISTPFYSV